MRAFKSVRRFFGLVRPASHVEPSKPWPRSPVDQAFDNILIGKIDDVTGKLETLDVTAIDLTGQLKDIDLTGQLKDIDVAAIAKRTRAEVNKLTPEQKDHYLGIAQNIMSQRSRRAQAQMDASAGLNKPEHKLGEMAYELRNLDHLLRLHWQTFGDPARSLELNTAMIEVHQAIIACDHARSWAADQWLKANKPEEWARFEAYKKECSDASCNAKHPEADPAVLSAIDQTP